MKKRTNEVEELLKLEYNELIRKLLSKNKTERDKILKVKKVKYKLFNLDLETDFKKLIQIEGDIIPILFSESGINVFRNTNCVLEKIEYILSSKKSYLDKLFINEDFIKLVLEYVNSYFDLVNLNSYQASRLIEYAENEKDIIKIIFMLNKDTIIEIFKSCKIKPDTIKKILTILPDEAINNIFKRQDLKLNIDEFSKEKLFSLFEKDVQIPDYLFTGRIKKEILTITDPKTYRIVINKLSTNNDTTKIENIRKKVYFKIIESFNENDKLLETHRKLYYDILNIEQNGNEDEEIIKIIHNYFNFFIDDKEEYYYFKMIKKLKNDKNKLKSFLQKESNILLTNIIIDYMFEDVYYNVLINIKEMLEFQNEYKTLDKNDIEIYSKIANLDMLEYNEKLKLFNKIRKINYVEKFYDDYRKTKNRALNAIKEEMLNFKNIQHYKNKILSDKYGINVYLLNGQPFYTLVKSLNIKKQSIIESELHSNVDGASYTLDSYKKLDTFFNPRDYYNIAFGDFNIDQVVHTFPVDSFSKYSRDSKNMATERIYKINGPKTLTENGNQYNEIVYSQKNANRTDELNESLTMPIKIAIYCFDKITKEDIKSAKNLGIGIILVDTSKYKISKNSGTINVYDTFNFTENDRFNYITNINQDALKFRR